MRHYLLLLWAIAGLASVKAQVTDSTAFQPYLEVGVHYQYLINTIEFTSPAYATDPYTGFTAGVSLRQATEKLFGFQLELGYARRGWEESFDTLAANYIRQIDYGQLAILTQVSFGNRFYGFLNAGTFLALPFSDKEIAPVGLNIDPDTRRRFYYGAALPRRSMYGLLGGPGFGIRFGPVTLQFEGRVVQSFSGVFTADLTTANTSRTLSYGGGGHLLFRF